MKNCEIVRIGETDFSATDLYNEHFRSLRNAAHSTGLPWDLSDDVALETLCSLFQRPERFDPSRASLRTYLCTIARSRAIDLFRKRRGDRLFCIEDEELEVLEERSAIHASLEEYTSEDAHLILTEAIRRLSTECRNRARVRAFTMYVIGEMSRAEVAEAERVSQDYVSLAKTRLYERFLAHMECIKQEDEEGRLHLSNNDISDLEEFIPFPEELS